MGGVTILRSAGHRRMPWKNGGGETTEIAVFPPDAGLDDFLWRVSMARVASDGPFSRFPGVERTLAILEGAGMALTIDGGEALVMHRQSPPLVFPADRPTEARLIDGPILDLNVMTRRGVTSHRVRRLAIGEQARLDAEAPTTLLLPLDPVEIVGEGRLDRFDAAILSASVEVRADREADAYLIEIRPPAPSAR